MKSLLLVAVFLLSGGPLVLADEGPSIKFPSPDGRFALRVTEPKDSESAELKAELIEKDSGKVQAALNG